MAVVTTAIIAGVGLVSSGYQTYKASQAAKGMQEMSEDQYNAMQTEKVEQQKKLDQQKLVYKRMKLENPYADIENQYAGMENVFEDLTVSTEAAEFQMEQGAQQRSNIMQQMRGAAGGSGIASLAQALAGQGALQARQVSADISQQEARNAAMKAQGAMSVQQMKAQGATAADMARRGGEAMLQEAETGRQATLLGMEQGSMAGANAAVQQAMSNQMSSMANQMQMHSDAASTYGKIGMQAAKATDWSSFGGGVGGGTIPATTTGGLDLNFSENLGYQEGQMGGGGGGFNDFNLGFNKTFNQLTGKFE